MAAINFRIERKLFHQTVYEKYYYLVRQAFDNNVFSWNQLDDTLYNWESNELEMKLFKNGPVSPDLFTEKYFDLGTQRLRIVKDALYTNLRDGATLVLNKLQYHSPTINELCMEVGQFMGEKANANGYAAFGGDGSFGKHWDTHDVFALQLIGRKLWRLYKPTFELPLQNQKSTNYKSECPLEPVLEVVLEAGDALYIPRGWWHEALPIPGEETFHIAVGLFSPKIIDYAAWLCSNKLPEFVESRKTLKRGVDSTVAIHEICDVIKNLLNRPENLDQFYDAIEEQQRVKSRFNISALSSGTVQSESLTTRVRVNSFNPIEPGKENQIINGFKVKLDDTSRRFLYSLSNYENSTALSKDGYTSKEMRLLKHLSQLDVVELIDRQ